MPRPRQTTSGITKYRMNLGWNTPDFAKEAEISRATITRLENGEPIQRVIAARYLRVLKIDLNKPSSLPVGWTVEDRGEKVILLAKNASA